jgi:ribosomal protein L2
MKNAPLVISATLLLATLAWAHDNQQHVMGTVSKIEGSSISVKAPDGTEKTVMVLEGTKFVKNGAAATQKDVKVGDRVVIHAMAMGTMLHASEVKIGEASKEPAHHDQH